MARVFISYNHKDQELARRLAVDLRKSNHQVWEYSSEMNVGDSLIQRISDAIKNADFLIALLSENSIASNWVQKELRIALEMEISDSKIRILPVLIDAVELPIFLREKVFASLAREEDYSRCIAQLKKAMDPIGKTGLLGKDEGFAEVGRMICSAEETVFVYSRYSANPKTNKAYFDPSANSPARDNCFKEDIEQLFLKQDNENFHYIKIIYLPYDNLTEAIRFLPSLLSDDKPYRELCYCLTNLADNGANANYELRISNYSFSNTFVIVDKKWLYVENESRDKGVVKTLNMDCTSDEIVIEKYCEQFEQLIECSVLVGDSSIFK